MCFDRCWDLKLTKKSDPIEAEAFANVLGKERSPSSPLYIGSIKSNFG